MKQSLLRSSVFMGIMIVMASAYCQNGDSLFNRQDTINLITRQMDADGTVESIGTGFAGAPSQQYHRFLYLLYTLSEEEFVHLFYNSTGCLSVYAYMGLLHNNYADTIQLLESVRGDASIINGTSGCFVGYRQTTEQMILNIRTYYWKEQTEMLLALLKSDPLFRKQEFEFISQ